MKKIVLLTVTLLAISAISVTSTAAPGQPIKPVFQASFDNGVNADDGSRKGITATRLPKLSKAFRGRGIAVFSTETLAYDAAGIINSEHGGIMFFIKLSKLPVSDKKWPFIFKINSQDGNLFLGLVKGQSRIILKGFAQDTKQTTKSMSQAIDWKPGEWHFVAVTWNANSGLLILYIDGKRFMSVKGYIANILKGPKTLEIGNVKHGFGGIDGMIDELLVYDRELDEAAINRIKQQIEHKVQSAKNDIPVVSPDKLDLRSLSGNLIYNGGFEDKLNSAWRFNVTGCRRPTVPGDQDIKEHNPDNLSSLKSFCFSRPNNIGNATQTILLPEGRYRISCRMKTRNLADKWHGVLTVKRDGRNLVEFSSPSGNNKWSGYSRDFTISNTQKLSRVNISIGMEPENGIENLKNSGKVWFDDIRLEPVLTQQALDKLPPIVISSIRGGGATGVYTPNQPITFKVKVKNTTASPRPSKLTTEVCNYYGKSVLRTMVQPILKGGETRSIEINIPPQSLFGFYSVRFNLAGPGNKKFTSALRSFVVAKPMNGKNDPVWGLAMQRNGIVLAPACEIIGIGRVIVPFFWRTEYLPGKYNWGVADQIIRIYAEHGIKVIGAIYEFFPDKKNIWSLPTWEAQRLNQEARVGGKPYAPGAKHYKKYADFVQALVSRYKDRITTWDMFNEIDGMAAGDNQLQLDYYIEKVKTFSNAAKNVDPKARIVALEATSGDARQGYPVLKKMWPLLKNEVDAIWPHPYPVPRMIGPGERIQVPEENIRQYLLQAAMIGRKDGKESLGISEIGYTIDRSLAVDSPDQKLMAKLTSRLLILARSINQLEYIGYFLAVEAPSDDPVHTYGMWENEYNNGNYFAPTNGSIYPRPVVAAYAAVARFLNRVIYAKRLKTSKNVYAFYFQKASGGIIALWGLGGNLKMDIDLPYSVNAYDLMGNLFKKLPAGHNQIVLTDSPLFIVVDKNEASPMTGAFEKASTNQPLICAAVKLLDWKSLVLKVRNQTRLQLPLTATLDFDGEIFRRNFSSAPLAVNRIVFNLKKPLIPGIVKGLVVVSSSKEQYKLPFSLDLRPVYKKKAGVDWLSLSAECQKRQPVDLSLLTPPDAKAWGTWQNDKDLSAHAWMLWDEQYLYFLVNVNDDIHIQKLHPRQMWKQDNMIIAIDTENDAFPKNISDKSGYDKNDVEFCFGLDNSGKEKSYLWTSQFYPVGEKIPGACYKLIRQDAQTIYQIKIPWKTITAVKPAAGRVMGINIAVTDCDQGNMRQYWRGISHGIHTAKDPALYKTFVLLP